MAFHNWRDAVSVARGYAESTGIRRSVKRDPIGLVWRVSEVSGA